MAKKLKRYEMVHGYSRIGVRTFVIREVGNSKANGCIASSWALTKSEEREILRLIEQANAYAKAQEDECQSS